MYTNEERRILALGLAIMLALFILHNSLVVHGEYHSCGNLVDITKDDIKLPGIAKYTIKGDLYRRLKAAVVSDNVKRKARAEREKDQERIKEQIEEEIRLGEMELLAQLIEAEAGNQSYTAKRLVGDVVINRIKSDRFPNSLEEVIFQDNQFACIKDGGFDRAGYYISEDSFNAAKEAYEGNQLDDDILFFTAGYYNKYCKPMYKYGNHYFGC